MSRLSVLALVASLIMNLNLFTHFMLLSMLFGICCGRDSLLWSLSNCWAHDGVAGGFACARLLDSTAYVRLAQKNGWSMTTFHTGNLVPSFLAWNVPALHKKTVARASRDMHTLSLDPHDEGCVVFPQQDLHPARVRAVDAPLDCCLFYRVIHGP